MDNKKIRVAITHGDTNGIGYELIFKAFEEPEMLEDLIIAAFNESVRKANDAMEQGMERAKGGLSIPGLF